MKKTQFASVVFVLVLCGGTGCIQAEETGNIAGKTEISTFKTESSDKKGLDKESSDKKDLDKESSDKKGLEKEGSDKKGLEKESSDKESSDKKGSEKESSDKESSDKKDSETLEIPIENKEEEGPEELAAPPPVNLEHVMNDETLLLEVEKVLKQEEANIADLSMEKEIPPEEYIPVLMYHHFVADKIEAGNGATVNIDEFDDHLKTFAEEGYTIISLEEMNEILLNAIAEKEKNPTTGLRLDKKYLCITIDDGYRSNYELAYPLLVKYDAKADISVITCRIHSEYVIANEIEKLCWDDLNEMRASGLVNIYTHSFDHTPANVDDISYFRDSVKKSEKELDKRLKNRSAFRVLTYPNGIYTMISQNIMRQEGYDIQLTTEYGVVNRDTLINRIPRVTVNSGETGEILIERIQAAAKNSFIDKRL